jgi:hypothetical protein
MLARLIRWQGGHETCWFISVNRSLAFSEARRFPWSNDL